MTKATISPKGRVMIPREIRDRLKLKPGTQVILDVMGEQVVMRRVEGQRPDWRGMRGMFRDSTMLDELKQERSAELARDDARLKGL